jgi:hypothetical protein
MGWDEGLRLIYVVNCHKCTMLEELRAETEGGAEKELEANGWEPHGIPGFWLCYNYKPRPEPEPCPCCGNTNAT